MVMGVHQVLALMCFVLLASAPAVVRAQPSWAIKQCPTPFTWSGVASQGNFKLSGGQGFDNLRNLFRSVASVASV
jgi:hypothetical protein